MFIKSFKGRILFPTVAILASLIALLGLFAWTRLSGIVRSAVDQKISADCNTLEFFFEASGRLTSTAALSMSGDPQVRAAIKRGGAGEILRVVGPSVELYHVNFITVVDGRGTVLARTHEPGRFGDSLLETRSVAEALGGRISTSFEGGEVAKVSVRTGAPVYDPDGSIVGAVSAGVRFDTQETIGTLKGLLMSHAAVFIGDTRIVTTLDVEEGEDMAAGSKLDPSIAKVVLGDGEAYYGVSDVRGIRHRTYYRPLRGPGGDVFAIFAIGLPMDDVAKDSRRAILYGAAIGAVGLAMAILALYYIVSAVCEPVVILSRDMGTLASGNLSIDMYIDREDEVGALGISLNQVVFVLRKLIRDINVMITEQRRGNTEYTLNTEEFHGDYKTLAINILELADLGLRDQLTGAPNRRSFGYRLELEWNRAAKDRRPIGVLIIDIDNFKGYNEAYGRQQGDAALQAVAGAIKLQAKRWVDMTARWGGEEFIVLLLDADAGGAMDVAEAIRAGVERTVVPCTAEGADRVTVSVGANVCVPSDAGSMAELVSGAESALYRAKTGGRNRSEICAPPP